jgi:phage gpG-like protein
VGALRRAIRDYFKGKERPDWMPEKLTPDEKHAVEEEKLMEILTRKRERIEARMEKESKEE